jgi:hypothetical protein
MAAKYWSEDEARRALGKLDASGLTVAEHARRSGIAEKRFRYWRRRLAGHLEPATPLFVPVRISGGAASASALEEEAPALEVLVGGRIVRVPVGFDSATLTQLMTVLERSC